MRLLAIAAAALFAASPPDAATVRAVDPMTVQDDDFARHRDPAEWWVSPSRRSSSARSVPSWRLWRIANAKHPTDRSSSCPMTMRMPGSRPGLLPCEDMAAC